MSNFLENLFSRASKLNKTIALAEGDDYRAAKAAEILTEKKICNVVLIGDKAAITSKFPEIKFDGVNFMNPATDKTDEYTNFLYELRKEKGLTLEAAKKLITTNNMYYAAVALKTGDVDGVVGGAVFSSADVSRAAFQVVKPAKGIKSVSSCFILSIAILLHTFSAIVRLFLIRTKTNLPISFRQLIFLPRTLLKSSLKSLCSVFQRSEVQSMKI